MNLPEKLVIATGNYNKYREFEYIIKKIAGHEVKTQIIFAPEISKLIVDETGSTYAENAILKAEAWSKKINLPCLADDSGLEVEILNGAPGLYSARIVEGDDDKKIKWLLENLSNKNNRNAKFVAVLALKIPGEKIVLSEGTCKGKINNYPAGINGFGYDPVFIPEGFNLTFAQMDFKSKNLISHRAEAFKNLIKLP